MAIKKFKRKEGNTSSGDNIIDLILAALNTAKTKKVRSCLIVLEFDDKCDHDFEVCKDSNIMAFRSEILQANMIIREEWGK